MSYLNLKSNKLYHMIDSKDILNNCIEVDEMISPIIQLLNERGYETTYSCSGHLFPDVYTDRATQDVIDSMTEEDEVCILSQEVLNRKYNDDIWYHITYEGDVNKSLYIAFKYNAGKFLYENIKLPTGFEWDELLDDINIDIYFIIRYYYKENEFFAFKKEQLEIIRRLYNWVKDLPVLSDKE